MHLPSHYALHILDAPALGGIDPNTNNEQEIHAQFLSFGIDKAVDKLLSLQLSGHLFIGCSIGGLLLWRAALQGMFVSKLVTISATRLRFETCRPSCDLRLYFGRTDDNKPDQTWASAVKVTDLLFKQGGHDIYKDTNNVHQIIKELKELQWIDPE